ncbi:MAG: GNAT family N-acetyltransferase [Oscillospiraceae bacterium]|nr:GNAT family N-acetyltransferase [Oscillospiraceae bacterium]
MEVIIKQLPLERFSELNKLFDMTPHPEFAETRRNNLATGQEICLIAELGGKLAGEINIMFKNDNLPEAIIQNRRAYLFALRVHEAAQGLGIGTILISEAIEACNKRGYIEQTIGVEPDNEPALHIYKSAGFKPFITGLKEDEFGKEITFDLLLRTP